MREPSVKQRSRCTKRLPIVSDNALLPDMKNELATTTHEALSSLPPALRSAAEHAAELATHARAAATRRAYDRAWASWASWAGENCLEALPALPGAVASYIGHLDQEGLRPASVDLALSAIAD